MLNINHYLSLLLDQYGYGILFFSLFLEMLGLPLPGEMIMTYTGLIVYNGNLSWPLCVAVGGAGATAGMTLAYWAGYRFGHPFLEKYGSRFHFGPDKLNGLSGWFTRYGNKMLIIAYFIPGVRHLTGYFAGTARLPFRKFAAYAYSGAAFWVFLFITIGKCLGPQWQTYHDTISLYMLAFGLSSALACLLFSFIKKHRHSLQSRLGETLQTAVRGNRTIGQAELVLMTAGFYAAAILSLAVEVCLNGRERILRYNPRMGAWIVNACDLGRR